MYVTALIYPRAEVERTYGVATVSRIDKLYVFFAEYSLFYRAVLQKRPII